MKIIREIISKLLYYKNTGLFHIFGANVINKIISFFSGILLVRILSKSEFGTYSYVLNVVSTVGIVSAMGMATGVFQLCSEHLDKKAIKTKIFKYGSAFGVYFNIGLSILLFFIASCVSFPVDEVNNLLKVASFLPVLSILVEFQYVWLRSGLMTKEYAYSNVVEMLIVTSFTIVGAFFYHGTGALLFRSISYFMAFVFIYMKTHAYVSVSLVEIGNKYKKDLFSISLISMLNNGLTQLLYIVDIYIIGAIILDSCAIATYKIATIIPTSLAFIPASIVVYIYPIFAYHKDDMQWVWSHYKKWSMILGGMNVVFVTVLYIWADFFIRNIFGDNYTEAVVCFRILLINYFITASFKIIIGNIMVMLRRLKFNLFESVVSGALNVVADYYLIREYGIEGAAYATILVTIISSFMSLSYLFYIYKKSIRCNGLQ